MINLKDLQFEVDSVNHRVHMVRNFEATVSQVWKAWTEPAYLDLWWAPLPYKNETIAMDFTSGGRWFYKMTGPTGDAHYCVADYHTVETEKGFSAQDAFCDAEGNINTSFPRTNWKTEFIPAFHGTMVKIDLQFESEAAMKQHMEMGFKEGFSIALNQLDKYLESRFQLWIDARPATGARVSTYLNFPGNTEEAFLFYKSVFGTDFVQGIRRFSDIPASADHPPVADVIKDMVLHVELPIVGGHILMGTDAPKEMGFTLTHGNNMHINIEPETREETKEIFDKLSEGGTIEMPLAEMFWGGYYGALKDKYGVNWMFNCR